MLRPRRWTLWLPLMCCALFCRQAVAEQPPLTAEQEKLVQELKGNGFRIWRNSRRDESGERIDLGMTVGCDFGSDEQFRRLAALPNITTLSIIPPKDFRADTLALFTENHRIETFSLGEWHFMPPEAVEALAKLKQVQTLALDIRHFTPSALNQLAHLNELTTATFYHVSEGQEEALGRWLAKCKNLTSLKLNSAELGGTVFTQLANCPLKSLHLEVFDMEETALAKIARIESLQALIFSETPRSFSWTHIDRFEELKRLEKLSMCGARGDETVLEAIGKITSLKSLDLSRSHFRGDHCAALAALPNLETLGLGSSRFEGRNLGKLKAAAKLKNLEANNTNITDEDLQQLNGTTQRMYLNLGYTAVTHQAGAKFSREHRVVVRCGHGHVTEPGGVRKFRNGEWIKSPGEQELLDGIQPSK